MYCPRCGTQNNDNNLTCTKCNYIFQPVRQTVLAQTDDYTLGGLIPYKNANALIAYYFAVFSFIPFLGIFLGITAFLLGLKGLRFATEHPEAKGKFHAWIGVLGGGFFGFGYFIISIILIGSSVFNK
jgi:hypothetical protein